MAAMRSIAPSSHGTDSAPSRWRDKFENQKPGADLEGRARRFRFSCWFLRRCHVRPELADLAARVVLDANFLFEDHGRASLSVIPRPIRNLLVVRISVLGHGDPGVREARPQRAL